MGETDIGSSRRATSPLTAKDSLRLRQNSARIDLDDDEAQIDPRGLAPKPMRKNSKEQRTRTSLLFVLFEIAMESGLIELKFIEQCSTIWKLDKFANASFHSHFQTSVSNWRTRLSENETLRNRLLKQHRFELEKLTYPLPKRQGAKPQRKRGYRDKGSTRPFHQRGRTDAETTVSVHFESLYCVEKVVVYGRRPTVTYRRLPYSGKIREALELGLLERIGDFYTPVLLEKD
jgi:hypothetical protein